MLLLFGIIWIFFHNYHPLWSQNGTLHRTPPTPAHTQCVSSLQSQEGEDTRGIQEDRVGSHALRPRKKGGFPQKDTVGSDWSLMKAQLDDGPPKSGVF